ncbi:MAG: Trk system potassium transporter TrkA [Erysipelotrichaceae bacterium]|nr:Trk system potassium transporter TrkA [Erysipelotrichaceae bacterium]
MKIIIVGCGKVGRTLAGALNEEGHDIVVVDTNAKLVESVSSSLDIMGIVGNGASYGVQMEAGVEEADLLLAVTTSDELNLLCCLIAKKAGNCHTIARVRNPIYNTEIGFIREELGLSMIINPEQAAADEIARLLRFPSAIKADTFAKGRVELLRVQLPEKSVLHNRKVMEIVSFFLCDVLVCAVERGEEVIIPNGNFVLQGGDKISFIASAKKAAEFFKKISFDYNQVTNTMIVGGSTIAIYLAEKLMNMGIEVKIIERDRQKCETLSEQLPNAVIINGDATEEEVLLEEGLEYMQSFVALTNFDEENIMLSLFAGENSKAKRVTKVNRISFENVVEKLNLGALVSPKHITANSILQYVRAMENASGNNVETLYRIINGKAEALAFKIKETSDVVGIPFEKMSLKKNLLICCIVRKNKIITPRGKDMIMVGDTVIVVTTNQGLNDIHDILA